MFEWNIFYGLLNFAILAAGLYFVGKKPAAKMYKDYRDKVSGDLDSAMSRARHIAAPANVQRFDVKTPCSVTGQCANCTSPDCCCSQIVVTRFCKIPGRIKVVLVGEELGL